MTQSAPNLMVVGFNDPDQAARFLAAVVRLQRQAQVRLHDAVLIERDPSGRAKVRQTQDVTPVRGAVGGALWGLLIGYLLGGPLGALIGGPAAAAGGALLGRLLDTGIKRRTLPGLRERVPPGKAALAVQISHVLPDTLAGELSRFPGAWLVESDLKEPVETAVRGALGRPA